MYHVNFNFREIENTVAIFQYKHFLTEEKEHVKDYVTKRIFSQTGNSISER